MTDNDVKVLITGWYTHTSVVSVMDKPLPAVETAKARKDSPLAQFSYKIGKVQIVEKDLKISGGKSSTTSSHGFHCSTCNASFTSSDAFLDHCNGKIHQKNLGKSLKVERVDEVGRVKARLQQLTQKRLAADLVLESKTTKHFDRKLDEAQAETDKLKEERKARKKQKRKQENDATPNEAADESDLMTLMGFKSFS